MPRLIQAAAEASLADRTGAAAAISIDWRQVGDALGISGVMVDGIAAVYDDCCRSARLPKPLKAEVPFAMGRASAAAESDAMMPICTAAPKRAPAYTMSREVDALLAAFQICDDAAFHCRRRSSANSLSRRARQVTPATSISRLATASIGLYPAVEGYLLRCHAYRRRPLPRHQLFRLASHAKTREWAVKRFYAF